MVAIQLKKALEQIMIPRYKQIEYVSVNPIGMSENWYKIIYYIKGKLENREAIEIMEETTNIYKMMGEEGGDIIVSFKKTNKD